MKINVCRDLYNIFHLALLLLKKRSLKKENYTKVHLLTFRGFFPNGGAGGGGAVLSANKVLLGENLNNIPLKYSFYEDNKFSLKRKNSLWDLWGAVEFVILKTKDENNCAYITHDYGSAFGLALMGKKYVLVSHIQGPRVEEKLNFGEKFSTTSELIIKFCEKYAFKNAFMVCFPSNGAYEYFCNSKYKTIKKEEFSKGETLYNTLYAFPEPEPLAEIEKKDDVLTFLSVGTLTVAKGMDRHPMLLKKILESSDKKIRYIMVGQGVLEKEILEKLELLKREYSHFDYIHIKKCSYPQIQYLQDISDVYLMLHRISIFDLATLEVMRKSKCVILSDAGGNPEFNKENNIILCDDFKTCANDFINCDLSKLGTKNKSVYDKYFSNRNFIEQYKKIIENIYNSNG